MSSPDRDYLLQHSAHNFDALIARWRDLIEPCCLTESTLLDHEEHPVIGFRTRSEPDAERGIYLCAGVHGDEPAGPWGLLEWAEANADFLKESAAVIFPCFNPWGLVNNRRHDARDLDLNRLFQDRELPVMAAWHDFIGGCQFRIALLLHEDYEARGTYLYELSRDDIFWGEWLLAETDGIIPREPRSEVDGREFENGILRRTEEIVEVVEDATDLAGSYPEAIYLYLHHARYSLTFETPSEYSLVDRVRAQRRFIEAALRDLES